MRSLLAIVAAFWLSLQALGQDEWNKASLGFECVDVEDLLPLIEKTKIRLPVKTGVIVTDVAPNGPAAGKLNQYDILLRIDKTPIKKKSDLETLLDGLRPGQEVQIFGRGHSQVNGISKWKNGNVKITTKTKRRVYIDALESSVDGVTETATYRHRNSPDTVSERTSLGLIIRREKNAAPVLLMRTTYVADDWLFVKSLTIKVDGKTFTIPVSMKRDNAGGGIWEWETLPATPHLPMLKAIAESTQVVTVRFQGDQYFKDHELSLDDTLAIRGVLKAFEAMGGMPN